MNAIFLSFFFFFLTTRDCYGREGGAKNIF